MPRKNATTEELRQYILDRIELADEAGCWLWSGSVSSGGYGQVYQDGATRGAHRVSYASFVGHIAAGFFICHRCDQPRCVNPAHLFAGTAKENSADRDSKGRGNPPKGARQHSCILSDEKVRAIRAEYADGGVTQRALASKHGVSYASICLIIARKSWQHVY